MTWTPAATAPSLPAATESVAVAPPKNLMVLAKVGRLPATVCSCILVWACVAQLLALSHLWHHRSPFNLTLFSVASRHQISPPPHPPPSPPPRIYASNGYLKVSCNGGLNQMRSAICDMVTVARLLNLTLVLPELDKKSFWADPSDFGDIFDARHFVDSLRDEVHIVRRIPKRFSKDSSGDILTMPPVSWSNDKYYLNQILPLFNKFKVIHFNKTDARLSNNGLPVELQKLRCRVNYEALRFTPHIESLGNKLVKLLRKKGSFVALHLRYEMDMLAFSGCTHGCSKEEAEELKRMRYAYPWWREKEIDSDAKRSQGLCPLTPEETLLVLKALGFKKDTQIYIASGEIYGNDRRLATLKAAFPQMVKKETLLDSEDLCHFRNHSSQMAAIDYIVSVASDVFIPTYDGNMAKVVEGHRRYLGFRKSILLDRKKLVELLDLHENSTISRQEFSKGVRQAHRHRYGQPTCRNVIADRPKEEDSFYSNPHECFVNQPDCYIPWNLSSVT